MARFADLLRTTTVRLTALFMLFFVLFAVLLLALISWQSSVQLQRQQADAIDRETMQLQRLDSDAGFRATILAVDRLSRQPGPGLYYLADPAGQMVTGNISELPSEVLSEPGTFSFNYQREQPFDADTTAPREGNAMVRSVRLQSGLILVVGRDVVERRGFTAIGRRRTCA